MLYNIMIEIPPKEALMADLTRSIYGCPCGRDHTCPISAVRIGEGAFSSLPALCEGYTCILLVADTNTYAACGREVEGLLGRLVASRHVFEGEGVVIPDEASVEAIEGKLTPDTDLIVGVGSGVINDLCKFVGHKHTLPYIIVATAPSMDGYASAGAASGCGSGMMFTERLLFTNSTMPSHSANRVKSRPQPTFLPGWKTVPH